MHGPGRSAAPPARVGISNPYGTADLEAAAEFLAVGVGGPVAVPLEDGPGPWFEANYPGECSACDERHIEPGDRIRADGYGGYEHEDCADDD